MESVRRSIEPRYVPLQRVPYEEMTEVERDFELEDRLIFLIAHLEQLMIRLLEQKSEQPAAAIRLMAEMVNRTVAQVEALPPVKARTFTLLRVLERAGRTHPLVRSLPVENNRLSVEMIAGAGQGRMWHPADGAPWLHEVCQGLMLALRSYLAFFENYYYSSVTRERWRSIYHVFIADLAYAIPHLTGRGNESQDRYGANRVNDN